MKGARSTAYLLKRMKPMKREHPRVAGSNVEWIPFTCVGVTKSIAMAYVEAEGGTISLGLRICFEPPVQAFLACRGSYWGGLPHSRYFFSAIHKRSAELAITEHFGQPPVVPRERHQ